MADPVDISEDSLRRLADFIRGGNSSAPPTQAAPDTAPAPASGLLNTLIQKVDALITAITGSKTAENLSNASQVALAVTGLKDASNLASRAINDLAGSVPVFGRALKAAGVDLNEYLKIAQQGSQQGVGQGNASELQERALQSGFKNVQEYLDYLKQNYNNSMRTIGRTAEDSSKKLADVAARASGTSEGQNLLKRNLITSDQLAQIAGIAAEGKSGMLKEASGRQELAEETAKLATMMQANAQVTGVSVDQQLRNRKESQTNSNDQLRMQALTNDQQRLQYTQNKALLEGQGKAMQDLTSTIYSGGRLSKDQQQLLQAATGGRGGQYIQAVREQRQTAGLAAEDPRRIEANKRLQDIVAQMSVYQASPEFARRAQTTSNADQQRAMGTLQEQNTEKYAIRNIMQESQVTPAEARRRATEMALQQGRGFKQEGLYDKEQVPNVGAKPFEVLAEANEQARKTVVAVATEINKMTLALGNNTTALDGLRTAMTPLAGPKDQTQQQRTDLVRDMFNGKPGSTGAPPGTDPVTGKPLTVETPVVNVQSSGPVTVTTTTPAPAPAPAPPTPAPATIPVEGTRGKGTYGETGATAEIKDVVAQLHKGETVLTPDQRENMIKDSANAAFDKLLGKKAVNGAEDQNVRYENVDKNDPVFVKMRQDNEVERAERAKFMRSREVADPMYAGGKRFETYDIREEAAKLKENASADKQPSIKLSDIQAEMTKGLSQEVAQRVVESRLDKMAAVKSSNDPAQIKTPKIDSSYANRAEQMMENQTQGIFSNLRSAVAKRQQQMSPNITDEFKNYQPRTATVTPVSQPAEPISQPRIETRETVTIKDLNDQLMMLNKSIAQLVHSSTTNGTFAEQQIRVTKKLSGNRFG